ncbi:MAG: MBOAT family O-acyltransferase [Evtepia gabavorous]
MLALYFDFSGYTDMALGVGKLLGFDLAENFRWPLAARTLTDFWRRWHITLGWWFRDHLYRPLVRAAGGKRTGCLLLVWLLVGLWHGAGWNFLLWGLLFGLLLAAERLGLGAG